MKNFESREDYLRNERIEVGRICGCNDCLCCAELKRSKMKNFFPTLNDALESENLLHTWESTRPPIQYGQIVSYTYPDGTKYGHFISIYRNESGQYERPVHYQR